MVCEEGKVCRYWTEYDDKNGNEYEFCKLERRRCGCGADEEKCSFIKHFKRGGESG